jgi:hypothetical protein
VEKDLATRRVKRWNGGPMAAVEEEEQLSWSTVELFLSGLIETASHPDK